MRRKLEPRDLRSLERRSMYSIFRPLDPEERLPRELLLEGRRHRLIDIRHLEIAGVLYLPALIVALLLMGAIHLNPVLAFVVTGVLFAAFFGFVVSFKNS
jgi:hypothetical protein